MTKRKLKIPQKTILVQSNNLSLVGLPFSEFQYNIWFAAVHELNNYRDKITEEKTEQGHHVYIIKFKPEDIPGFELKYTKRKLKEILENTAHLVISRDIGDIYESMPIYTLCRYNWKTKEIEIGINPLLIGQLRQLKGEYTQYFFEEAIIIKGKYAKALYTALSCNEFKNEWIVKIDELKKMLHCPESYEAKQIIARIIKPFYKRVTEQNESQRKLDFTFEYELIYKKVGRTGQRKVESIRFYEIRNYNMQTRGDIVLSMDKEKLFYIFRNEMCSLVEGSYLNAVESMEFKHFDSTRNILIITFTTKDQLEWFLQYEELIMDLYKPTLQKYFPEAKIFYEAKE